MKLRHQLMLYLGGLHVLLLGGVFFYFQDQPGILFVAEISILLSLSLGIVLTKRALKPYVFTQQFQDLLQDENYAARIRSTPSHELNDLVQNFNRMLELLYTERIRLGEQRGLLDKLLDAIPSAVFVFDFDGRLSLINASAKNLLEHRVQIGAALELTLTEHESITHDNTARLQKMLDELNSLAVGESKLIAGKDGLRYRCQRNQFIDRGFCRDFLLVDEITAALQASEKATYDKVVRVLAHEVNNTVAVTGSVMDSLLFYRAQLRQDDQQDFGTAVEAVRVRNQHLAEFIERFTQVVKMPEPILRSCNVAEVIDRVLVLYKQQCESLGIQLLFMPMQNMPVARLDRHLFEQALMNVFKNAIEAASTRLELTATEHDAYVHVSLDYDTSSQALHLMIVDSGKALIDVPQDQLFTPFFTTKKGGQGIGLMFVREVCQRHGFAYRLISRTNGDAEFSIRINI
ncbi:sensor histidine kinase [Undibacterium flavidum]|uniref:histidine kinase n=1 Tax=Undibacterium flavidum TaxID=2762297 RepID=A0ABR6Y6A2_9BURK|nr:ATP-binding protein [Undibacterium flavidum]MBC3872093.1 GHKL domain-containing protein [Undibacterium flavidum]